MSGRARDDDAPLRLALAGRVVLMTYARIRPVEAALAAAQAHSLCWWCEEHHFRPYPEQPGRDCLNVRCGCWCTTRRGQ